MKRNEYQIIIINPSIDGRWDEFVLHEARGSIYHHSAWLNVLEETYGYDPLCIALETIETCELKGLLPFVLVKSKITGNRIVSLPMTPHCQPLFPTTQLSRILFYAIKHYPHNDYVQCKVFETLDNLPDMIEKTAIDVTHILDLERDLDVIFRSFHKSSVRTRIRKADENGLTLRMGNQEEDLKKFYLLHTRVRKKAWIASSTVQVLCQDVALFEAKELFVPADGRI